MLVMCGMARKKIDPLWCVQYEMTFVGGFLLSNSIQDTINGNKSIVWLFIYLSNCFYICCGKRNPPFHTLTGN